MERTRETGSKLNFFLISALLSQNPLVALGTNILQRELNLILRKFKLLPHLQTPLNKQEFNSFLTW